ncbi:hypothetical protein MTR67_022352 [Solanum verrucosum]|uniref:Uncharacterized protein n=1 Tax=Solanum verrucosum TaxID=315347 RepID=A0AAF0QUP3_SOLVR|nr:hypothetical protein MTR67_022352 [Solanum verrucosum]
MARVGGSWFTTATPPQTSSKKLAKSRLTDRPTVRRSDHGPWSVSVDRDFPYQPLTQTTVDQHGPSIDPRLIDSAEGRIAVRSGAESSLVSEVKEKQDQDPILLELKANVQKQKVLAFEQGGNGVLRYQENTGDPENTSPRKTTVHAELRLLVVVIQVCLPVGANMDSGEVSLFKMEDYFYSTDKKSHGGGDVDAVDDEKYFDSTMRILLNRRKKLKQRHGSFRHREGNDQYKYVDYLFNDMDSYLDIDLMSCEQKPHILHHQQHQHSH